jgi:GT2 family glycosyltransferase
MKWIDKCLGSIYDSTILLDVIIIDNGSTDGTQNYVKINFPNTVFIQNERNLGFGKANNIGIKYAIKYDYDYVYLLNQDAWIEHDTIEKLIKIHILHPEYGVLSPIQMEATMHRFDKNLAMACGEKQCPGLISDLYTGKMKEVYNIDFVMAAHWLVSIECLKIVGGFASIFSHYGEDDNFLRRVIYQGYKVGICPTAKAVHDREFRNNSPQKIIYLIYTSFLSIATNINKPLRIAYTKGLCFLIIFELRNILKYHSFSPFKYIGIGCFMYFKVLQNRKIMKTKGAFL